VIGWRNIRPKSVTRRCIFWVDDGDVFQVKLTCICRDAEGLVGISGGVTGQLTERAHGAERAEMEKETRHHENTDIRMY
jgi:hypothetical protein